ncbi:MAG: electron transfer flavoprotein subunit beta/FixA family protein [Planctomycetota bacterium]|nr:electron transfer flavoprotein subunit beta/FixA family protein [Planctomycetota bacterium]
MPYNFVVLVKQVPDTKRITGEAMRDDGTVNRSALPAIFNPEDLHALELALELRDGSGGRVTVVTMGPPQACEVLRQSLERGADDAVLLTDRRAAASDTLATSYILSCAVRRVAADAPVDMVLCGRQAIDGDTAQVPPQTAEKLGWPQVTYVESVEDLSGRRIRVKRNTGAGWERVEASLPCLLTVTDQGPEPRPASAKRLMAVKRARSRAELAAEATAAMPGAAPEAVAAEVEKRAAALAARGMLIRQWTLDDIKADLAWCGRDGSPTKVKRIQSVVLKGTGFKKVEAEPGAVAGMVHELIEDHTIG